ncbi:hypothetical protein BH23GEM8_BH23GEM8_17670 [soil metagenome]
MVLSWSGGKDSSLTLHVLRADPEVMVVGLLTTVTSDYDRISMHGVRRSLLEQQAAAVEIPLHVVEIEARAANDSYEQQMRAALMKLRAIGVETVAFGDLFLEDVRRYREDMMKRLGMSAVFPLWHRNTEELASEFIALGFRAVTTCIDTQQLDASFAGRWFDEAFLADLPSAADPCGENGEFHTFVTAGPVFTSPISIGIGELQLRDGRFQYCDLLPVS